MDGPIRAPVVLKSLNSFRKAIGCSAKPRILFISLNRLINYMNTNTYKIGTFNLQCYTHKIIHLQLSKSLSYFLENLLRARDLLQ